MTYVRREERNRVKELMFGYFREKGLNPYNYTIKFEGRTEEGYTITVYETKYEQSRTIGSHVNVKRGPSNLPRTAIRLKPERTDLDLAGVKEFRKFVANLDSITVTEIS